ncbi:testis-specific serine/threonine-protein kinase 6-like [Salminus brasiliensis]|uniref:testis-specific serine/threonine-protein kinase 6-like n=1 Tax=Salminus brasiliensis TaxID=930266 RepID=UPI003B839A16
METTKVLRSLGYEVLDDLGAGVFGNVKLATSDRHPNLVAIKIMDRKQMTPHVVSKFLPRELAIIKRVRHPHIIQVHEMFEMANGQVFVVMEAASMNLVEKVEQHLIPIDQAKQWFAQIVDAMVYLHEQDIVHRDLKCENVLLTADNQVKITDFGFSRISKGFPELSDTFCGSPFYAAPEVIMSKAYDPKKSDVWSLGVILYVMVVGCLPFYDSSWKNLPSFQSEPLVYPEGTGVEEKCHDFISYMLEFDPATRPSMAEVAQHPWLESTHSSPSSSKTDDHECEGQDGESRASSQQDVNPLDESQASCSGSEVDTLTSQDGRYEYLMLQEDSSGAGASLTCQNVEDVGEESGCRPLSAAVERAANARTSIIEPILKASRSLRQRMKKFFKRNFEVHDSSATPLQEACNSASSTEAPALPSSEQTCGDKQRTKRLRLPKFKFCGSSWRK